ncbi:unnamed protein product, partial [marine sediment metagenome]
LSYQGHPARNRSLGNPQLEEEFAPPGTTTSWIIPAKEIVYTAQPQPE